MSKIEDNPLFKDLEFLALGEQPDTSKETTTFTQEQLEASLKAPVAEVKEEEKPIGTAEEIINEIKNNNIEPEVVVEESAETPEPKTEIFTTLSEMFKEEGLLEEDFKSSEEMFQAFSKKVNDEVTEGISSYKDSIPSEIKELLENYEAGVPFDELLKTKSNQIRFSSIDDTKLGEDEDLQKSVYTQYLKETTRYSDAKIQKEVERLADLGELAEEAKIAKKELVEAEKDYEKSLLEQSKKQRIEQEKADKELYNKIHKQVKETKEIIPGVKLNDKESEELFKTITTAVEIRGNQPISLMMQTREADPVKFDMTLAYLIKQGVFSGDWSKITKTAETKVVTKLEKQLEEKVKETINRTGVSATQPSKDKAKNTMDALQHAIGTREAQNNK